MQYGLNADLLQHQEAKRLVAHARRGAWAVWNVNAIHTNRFEEARSFDFAGGLGPSRRHDLHHGDELALGNLAPQLRALPQRRYFYRLGFGGRRRSAPVPWVGNGAQKGLHDMNVVGSSATATADETNTDVNKSSGILCHVFRRAEIDIAPLHGARHAGIGLRRQWPDGDRPDPFQRVQHGHGADAAVTSHDFGAPGFNLRTIVLGG